MDDALDRLDAALTRALESLDRLREENRELRLRISELQSSLGTLQEEGGANRRLLARYQRERHEVRERVERVLKRVAGLEKSA